MGAVTLESHGAARTVTGSRHLIATPTARVLLDCGMVQGSRSEANARNRQIDVEPDVVILSHAHIDHSGALPTLVRQGYRGAIHATSATRDLCRAMLADSARIQASDARYLNKRRRAGEDPVEAIYTQEDVQCALKQFVTHPYDRPFEAAPGVRATFRDAGHIIGSAGVLLECKEGPSVYFTGDLGRHMYPILRDPEPLPDVDVVLCESTYGTRDHEPVDLAEDKLRAIFQYAVEQKGKVLIPAFSVGRTQNLIYACARMRRDGVIPDFPVFVDSPLAEKATRVFAAHPECFDREIREFVSEGGRPFYPRGLRYTSTREESIALNDLSGPMLILAASGMCEGGRITHHLKRGLPDKRNTVLFVGWQAPHTLGRRIVEGCESVRVLGRKVPVRARVASLRAYSAHADRSGLLAFLEPAKQRGTSVMLVHGDEDTSLAFADTLRTQGHRHVFVPKPYEVCELTQREDSA